MGDGLGVGAEEELEMVPVLGHLAWCWQLQQAENMGEEAGLFGRRY